MFPYCLPVSHTGNTASSVSFCFQNANYKREGILRKIRACEPVEKKRRARTSERSSKFSFASNSSKGQILRCAEHFQIGWDYSIPLIMGLANIDPHSHKAQTTLYKIPTFGVNRPNCNQDTAILKCQNLQRSVWPSELSVRMAKHAHFFANFDVFKSLYLSQN